MATPPRRRMSTLRCISALVLLWASGVSASAGPANCVGELNDEQKVKSGFCASWGPCAWIMSIQDTCSQSKSWLSNLGAVSRPEDITLERMEDAARGMSVVEMRAEEDENGPALVHCLPFFRDKAKCRQYIGIDPIPVKVAPTPKPRDPDLLRRQRMLALYKEEDRARLRLGGPWWEADAALTACAKSRAQSDRAGTCARAKEQVLACGAARADWRERKETLLAEIDALTPGLGTSLTPGISPLRGLGAQANPVQMWNDTVHGLRRMELPTCPATLPSTSLSPSEALAAWAQEEQKLAADIARCDAMSRDTFEAIDEGTADRAASLADSLEAGCARLSASYANRVELARRQIGVLRAAAAMPARSTGYGTSLFKSAVQQAQLEAQDPAARQARLRAERDALEARIAANAASGRDEYNPMNLLLGMVQVAVDVHNARNGAAPSMPIQPRMQYTPPLPGPVQPVPLPDPGFRSASSTQPQTAQQAQQQAQFLAQQRARVDASNRQAVEAAERLRQQNAALAEQLKFYPSLRCAFAESNGNGITQQCMRNRCGETVTVNFAGGRVDVGPGNCYPFVGSGAISSVCRYNDRFYPDRQQCKRP